MSKGWVAEFLQQTGERHAKRLDGMQPIAARMGSPRSLERMRKYAWRPAAIYSAVLFAYQLEASMTAIFRMDIDRLMRDANSIKRKKFPCVRDRMTHSLLQWRHPRQFNSDRWGKYGPARFSSASSFVSHSTMKCNKNRAHSGP